jgi:hypothetical protein
VDDADEIKDPTQEIAELADERRRLLDRIEQDMVSSDAMTAQLNMKLEALRLKRAT